MTQSTARKTIAALRLASHTQKSLPTLESKLDAILDQLIKMNSRLLTLTSRVNR